MGRKKSNEKQEFTFLKQSISYLKTFNNKISMKTNKNY